MTNSQALQVAEPYLKFALLTSGIPQYLVARDCQMSETRLSRIVRGRAVASPAERIALASRLGRSVDELFPGGLR